MAERLRRSSMLYAFLLICLLGLAGYWFLSSPAWQRPSAFEISQWIERLGVFGPFVIIFMMSLAVVASPIPSAPIALAAGAAFGQVAGAIYVAIGAETGALVAFAIARVLGKKTVDRLVGARAASGLLGSQNALTFTVFVSRLMPFISFDVMSYAAGLSQIHPWRFILATLAGILPASFVLAYLGAEAMSGGFGSARWVAIGLGLMTGVPVLIVALRHKSGALPLSPQLKDSE
ncbi:MAG: TVP38/TMEM64 family protein [Paracoccaceae bacterium]|uniref:TVP38/TMEM64 family membrane protein n=2 Tax=Roseobacteraceae TaxID=2854170 RepID=A0A0U1NJ94_9RHOB|nr:VTT domain-containing protein [Nereida ignava]CRK74787.1 TVP38/TMEM64 family inner membrane protein YdjZ [Nereida ignava]SFJ87203.1 Uncharacterized membrane protein YdjX, TVP38/TMEM64 family, SNARE-associated domain [Nereida ignava DSM 16309]